MSVLFCGLFLVPPRAACPPGFHLDHQDSSYQCTIGLVSNLPPDTLFDVFADTSAVRALTADADSIHFSGLDSPCCTVRVYYTYVGYRAVSVFHRCIDRESGSITMDLTTFSHNWDAIPAARKVHAHYGISAYEEGSLLCYYQTVTTDRSIGWLGIRLVRWQLRSFAKRLESFLRGRERERGKQEGG
jgi:hypothetical protein